MGALITVVVTVSDNDKNATAGARRLHDGDHQPPTPPARHDYHPRGLMTVELHAGSVAALLPPWRAGCWTRALTVSERGASWLRTACLLTRGTRGE